MLRCKICVVSTRSYKPYGDEILRSGGKSGDAKEKTYIAIATGTAKDHL
jgi:hypothetical protein